MSDRWAVLVAVSALAGALNPQPVPVLAAALVVAAGLWWRAALVVCVGVALSASALSQRAHDGLAGVREAVVAGDVVLATDPRPAAGGVRAEARVDGRRVELRAAGANAEALAPRLAGEVVSIRGRLAPIERPSQWLRSRHIAGRLTVLRVDGWRSGEPASRLANGLRRTLVAGAAPLSPTHRSLYTGLVIGDDRAQPAALADDFLGAGMTHLLAVSGQNVAFCLVLAGPVLRRLRLWPRLGATLAVIGLFGLMTRFEPSVLRAAAMAALAATLVTIGRPVSRLRVISLAVAGLLLVDPLLVHAVGFQLSLAAATAIVVLAPSIRSVMPGPPVVAEALGVTIAAQLGVAPVLLATFGPMPVASIPANLLAVPVAGLVMVWGLTAGLAAGAVGGPLPELVQAPTRLGLWWLELVAHRASSAPLGHLHMTHLVVVSIGLSLAVVVRRRAALGLALATAAVLGALATANAPPPLRSNPQVGLVRWHASGSDVVVLGGVGGRAALGSRGVLEDLRQEGVGAIDMLVLADDAVSDSTIRAVLDAHPTGVVVAFGQPPDTGPVPVERAPPTDTVLDVGALQVRLTPTADRVVVDARRS